MNNRSTSERLETSEWHPGASLGGGRTIGLRILAIVVLLTACAPKGEALYTRAEKSLAQGEPHAAVIDLKNLVAAEPQNAKARALLAEALVASGEIQAGAVEVQKAKDLGAPKEMTIVPECRVFLVAREFEKVLSQCKLGSASAGTQVALQVLQGGALLSLGRAAEAKAAFQVALTAEPGNIEALLGLAGAMYTVDGPPAAQALLEKAPDSIKQQSRYWIGKGNLLAYSGDFAGAERAFANAFEKADKNPGSTERLAALRALAEAQVRQGKVKEATASSEQLIKAFPNNPMVKQLRGQVAAASGDLEMARTLLEEAVAAMPENYDARLALGMVNLQQGNRGQAEMHFAAVVANQPDNARAQRLLTEARAGSQPPEATLESLKQVLAQPTVDTSVLAMAGRLSLAAGDREQGIEYLTRAAAQATAAQSPDAQFEAATGLVMAGDFDRAIETLKAMPEGGATANQREKMLMLALLRKGDKQKAVAEAEALISRSGNDPAARNLAGSVFSAVGKLDAAREQFDAALKLKPNDPETLSNLARLDLVERDTESAKARFRQILEADPKNLIAELGMAIAASAQGDSKESEKWLQKATADHPASLDAQLALVRFYVGRRDFGKARAVIDEALKKVPDDASLLNARGLVMLGLNDTPGAIASFKQATERAPNVYGYSLNLARAHLANRDIKGALDVLNNVLKQDPKYVPALTFAAAVVLEEGDIEKATGYVERLKQVAPTAQSTYAAEGDLAMVQKRYGQALESYRKAAASGTNLALVMAEYRAATMAGSPHPSKALEDWVKVHPDDFTAGVFLAEARQRNGDTSGAVELYESLLTKQPDNAVVLNNLAVLYGITGNPKALEVARKAYAAAPKSPGIQDTYGWLLFQSGETGKAMELLSEAISGMPDNAEVQYHYAAVLAKQGRVSQAIPLLKKAIRGSLPAPAKTDAETLLQQLSK
jgi:putative PEP-CTERM system TPR-repeat lipoprotein